MSEAGLYDCSSSSEIRPENAIFAYSSTLIDQQLLFDTSPNNLNASVHSSAHMHCDYINDSFLSLGGVIIVFPLEENVRELKVGKRPSHHPRKGMNR